MSKLSKDAFAIMAMCEKTKEPFGITVDPRNGCYAFAWAFKIKKEQAKSQAVQIKNAQIKVDKTRKKLSDVMVDRKTHEKLREKAFGEFLSELDDSEKKEIDELVSFRFKNEDDN